MTENLSFEDLSPTKREGGEEDSSNLDFEKGMTRMREIVEQMANPSLSLKDRMNLYKESKELSQKMHELLDRSETFVRNLEGEKISYTKEDEE